MTWNMAFSWQNYYQVHKHDAFNLLGLIWQDKIPAQAKVYASEWISYGLKGSEDLWQRDLKQQLISKIINACLGILGVLDHNKQVVPVRSHHDLMLLKKSFSINVYFGKIEWGPNIERITFVLILKKVRSLVGSSSLNIVFAWSTRFSWFNDLKCITLHDKALVIFVSK